MRHQLELPSTGQVSSYATAIISAHCTGMSHFENYVATLALRKELHEKLGIYNIWKAQGCYDGVTEKSFVVRCHDLSDVLKVIALGKEYKQDCVLLADHCNSTVSLQFMDGQVSIIGRYLKQVDDVRNETAYTMIGQHAFIVE